MTARGVWEERLWTSNAPLPRRRITAEHPIYGLPRQYIFDDQVLLPWTLFGLVDPVPPEWEPLPEHHEAAYLMPGSGQLVRIGLVDYSEGTVVAWRKTGMAKRWQSTRPRAAPAGDDRPTDPIAKPRRQRSRTRRTAAAARPADPKRTTT